MCNLYSFTKGQAAIRDIARVMIKGDCHVRSLLDHPAP